MDMLFRDQGNITPFGILDTGADPSNDYDDDCEESFDIGQEDSDGDTTDGHDHGIQLPNIENDVPPLPLPLPTPSPVTNTLNNDHNGDFLDGHFSSPPPTPNNATEDAPNKRSAKKSVTKSQSLTAEEHVC
ncbi:hypothetical protein DFH28DRAFT_1136024 [Melampsora americana]|nr:hypothetical protein DFH28DRAFT_1136024 [Melampsora americana]